MGCESVTVWAWRRFGRSRSGPLVGFWNVRIWSVDGVQEFRVLSANSFGISRSGPLTAFGMSRSVSRSGPLMGFWNVTVWSADGVLECHGLVR